MSQILETNIEVTLTGRDRTTVFWRGILVAPVAAFALSFTQTTHWGGGVAGVMTLPVVLALLFRGVYPSYALSFNHALLELNTRVCAYLFLLTDEYPSIERNENISVIFPDVEGGKKLHPALPLVKWLLVIPVVIVGLIYSIGAIVTVVLAWFNILFTGEYPEWAAKYVLSTITYWNEIFGYAVVLVSDKYPRFSL